jgi:signal transduction histidine kinase
LKAERPSRIPSTGPPPTEAGPTLLVHSLKNLAGRLGLLLQNADERYEDPIFKETVLAVLDDTVGQLRRLAHDLRDHEGRLLIKLRADLNFVVQAALGELRSALGGQLILEESYEPVPQVWADAFLLRCAFCCAIENAIEAMDGAGVLTVSTRQQHRGGRCRVTVEIADTGPGMSPEFVREHLFRPFSTTKEEGLGLGAYTFRQVAALHGGSVRILSAEGCGTRLRFHFPAD